MNVSFWKKVAGVLLIILGVVGLVLPLAPGLIFIIFGAELLGFGLLSRESLKRYYEQLKAWWRGEPVKVEEKKEEIGP